LERWAEILTQQYNRISHVVVDPQDVAMDSSAKNDSILYVFAFRNLLRVAKLTRERFPSVKQHVRAFERSFPDAGKLRNVLEHFDEYEQERGEYQSRAKDGNATRNSILNWVIGWRTSLTDPGVKGIEVGDGYRRYRLDIDTSYRSAQRMVTSLTEFLEGILFR